MQLPFGDIGSFDAVGVYFILTAPLRGPSIALATGRVGHLG
jgi:hypothetical protein